MVRGLIFWSEVPVRRGIPASLASDVGGAGYREDMRILHTSDWHIGRTFHGHSTIENLRTVLAALAVEVRERAVDVVVVSGDIFDSATPAAEAYTVLESAVLALREAGATVVLTSGNHDSATRLGFMSRFSGLAGVHVVTRHDQHDEPITLSDEHGPVHFYGIPYLEPALIRHHYPEATLRTHEQVLGFVMDRIRADSATRGGRSVVMSHCFAVNVAATGDEGTASDVERDITAGGIDYVPLSVFDGPDYVALGHIHGRSTLSDRVRYSGAPLHYSFSEAAKPRGAWLVDLDGSGLSSVDWVDLPVPRALRVVTGMLDDILDDTALTDAEGQWLSVILTDTVRPLDGMRRLQARFPFCVTLEHRPAVTSDAPPTSYGSRVEGQSDLEIVSGFLAHVRNGVGPSDSEREILADVFVTVERGDEPARDGASVEYTGARRGRRMKIQRLCIAGFGPYKDEQRIDFERFDDDGIFLITGKTGAGKSSLLDAICFALYGSVPRYDGTQPKLRSDYCALGDPTFVDLEFRVNGTSYRVRRTPEYDRPKARGTGTTTQKATAELFEHRNDAWEGVAARPVDVAHALEGILGLSKDQFLQVILLAQNRFQEFLLAKNDERQTVLRTLFGTRRFEQVEVELVERRKALGVTIDSAAGSLRGFAERAAGLVQLDIPDEPAVTWFDGVLAELEEMQEAAARGATVADAEFTAADAEHRALQDTRRLQLRRDSARTLLETFEAQTPAIDADRIALANAIRAASVWAHVAGLRRAVAAADEARAAAAERRESFVDLASGADGADTDIFDPAASGALDSAALEPIVGDLGRRLGSLDPVLADEASLPGLRAEVTRQEENHEKCRTALTDAEALIAALPQELEDTAESLSAARVTAAGAPRAKERVTAIDTARAAAQRAVTLDRQLIEARFAEKDASTELTAATRKQDDLFSRRLAGFAAKLAADLTDDSACAVCGSVEHPHPATSEGTPVRESDIEAARAEVAAKRAALDAATAHAQSLVTELAGAHAAADNKSMDELEAELIDATTALIEIDASASVVAECEETQAELKSALESAAPLLAGLRAELAVAADDLTAARSRLDAALARVDVARSTFETVGDRAGQLTVLLNSAKTLSAALSHAEVREAAVVSSRDVLATQLAENGFASEQEVAAARREPAEISALDARITEYDQSVTSARATLAEPELAAAPFEVIDLEPAAERVALASAARDNALQGAGLLADRVTQLRAIVTRVHQEEKASAGLREEYDRIRALAAAVAGNEPNTRRMRLETYVLAAQLEEIVRAANARLRTMTSGRYTLQHDDTVQYRNTRSGLGLAILDEHTGRSRATHSLSGGETFLASLALALGLAEVVTNQAGGITLDTLFIDEGFGSLDGETLEIAMSTLDSLRSGGRTIGLISHVDAMKEQIPAKLRISVTDGGSSRVDASLDLV